MLPGAPVDAVCEAPSCALGTYRWGTSLARPLPTNRLADDVVNTWKQSHRATAQASFKPGDSMGQGSSHQRQMQLRLKVFLVVTSWRGVNNNKGLPSIMLRDKTQPLPRPALQTCRPHRAEARSSPRSARGSCRHRLTGKPRAQRKLLEVATFGGHAI